MDIKSGEDLGERMRSGLGPLSSGARLWLEPLKTRLQGWLGPAGAGPGAGQASDAAAGAAGAGAEGGATGLIAEMREGGATAELSRRLQARFHTKKGGEGGEGGAAEQ